MKIRTFGCEFKCICAIGRVGAFCFSICCSSPKKPVILSVILCLAYLIIFWLKKKWIVWCQAHFWLLSKISDVICLIFFYGSLKCPFFLFKTVCPMAWLLGTFRVVLTKSGCRVRIYTCRSFFLSICYVFWQKDNFWNIYNVNLYLLFIFV